MITPETLPTRYEAGTASVTAGQTKVTQTDAAWFGNVWGDDLFFLPSQPMVPPQRIAEANQDGTLTLAFPWPGATAAGAAYEVRYVGIIERSTAQSRRVLEQLGEVSAYYDVQVNTLADRAAFDGKTSGYRVLVSNIGDGRAAIYSKKSDAAGDWSAPAYFSGPIGLRGWSAVYAIVADGARRVEKLVEWVGGEGVAPTYGIGKYRGAAGLVENVADGTDVRGAAGQNGTGTGDVVGPENSTNNRLAFFDGPTGKLLKDAANLIADPVGFGITPVAGKGAMQVRPQGVTPGAPVTTGTTDPSQVAHIGGSNLELSIGVRADGSVWAQPRATSSYAANYDLILNPNGGQVLMPQKSAFHGFITTGVAAGNYFGGFTMFHNVGGNFNPTTGRYTAPKPGLYHFDFSAVNVAGSGVQVLLAKNATVISTASYTGASANQSIAKGFELLLAANDIVGVFVNLGNVFADTSGVGYNSFSGFLVG